jgi:small subunit ribosomal protein S20
MANIQSQIKRNRQNEKARLRNKAARTTLKGAQKRFRTAEESGDVEAATSAFDEASRTLDKAASKGLVHRNFVANHKSKMAKRLASLSS